MGPVDSLITWCNITISCLPGASGHSSWNFNGSLTGTFVVSGLWLLFYRSWNRPKVADFSSSDGVMLESVVGIKSWSPGYGDLGSWQGTIRLDRI